MAVLGIQNMDRWTARLEKLKSACSLATRDKAMEAAGEVLKNALVAATPVNTNDGSWPQKYPPGQAKRSVINVKATKQKEYGVTRQLIGYSKDAYYMFWREFGHKIVRGGSLKGGGKFRPKKTGRSGKGHVVGYQPARPIMRQVFDSTIGKAMDAAREVIRKEAGF